MKHRQLAQVTDSFQFNIRARGLEKLAQMIRYWDGSCVCSIRSRNHHFQYRRTERASLIHYIANKRMYCEASDNPYWILPVSVDLARGQSMHSLHLLSCHPPSSHSRSPYLAPLALCRSSSTNSTGGFQNYSPHKVQYWGYGRHRCALPVASIAEENDLLVKHEKVADMVRCHSKGIFDIEAFLQRWVDIYCKQLLENRKSK